MRFTVPIMLGALAAMAVLLELPAHFFSAVAWAVLCASIALSIVDVLVWQIVKGLDDYVRGFAGPSSAMEEVLKRVRVRKARAFTLFLVNFGGRTFSAAVMGAVTTGKLQASAHPLVFAIAVGNTAFSLPILLQQIVSYFRVTDELGQQLLRVKRDAEREDDLRGAAERPTPMTHGDKHTAGYTKVAQWPQDVR